MADHTDVILSHSEEFIRIKERLYEEEQFTKKMIGVSADHKAAIDNITDRLDKNDEQTKVLMEMSASIKYLVEELKDTSTNIKELMTIQTAQHIRISDIEKEKYDTRFEALETKLTEIDGRVAKKVLKYIDGMIVAALGLITCFILYTISGGKIGK